MVSIIITTYREPRTLEKSLNILLNEEINQDYEILVVAPDKESREVVNKFCVQYPQVKFLQDRGVGKPAALNLAFKKLAPNLFREAHNDILILTDGDVVIEQGSINELLKHFQDKNPSLPPLGKGGVKEVGAVCGQPISISPRNTMLGYWSHWLVNAAHQRRLKLSKQNKYFDCSGYLYAIRAGIVNQIPENVLSDDIYISKKVWGASPSPSNSPSGRGRKFPHFRQGGGEYKIIYEPNAKVKVKYPTTFKDWLKQKKRSAGGTRQKFPDEEISSEMRSFIKEAWYGIKLAFTFPKNLKEFWWTFLLFLARIYLWILIFIDLKIKKKKFEEVWQRVESSK